MTKIKKDELLKVMDKTFDQILAVPVEEFQTVNAMIAEVAKIEHILQGFELASKDKRMKVKAEAVNKHIEEASKIEQAEREKRRAKFPLTEIGKFYQEITKEK